MKRLVLFGWLLAVLIAVGCDTGSTSPDGDVPPTGGDSAADETASGDAAAVAPPADGDPTFVPVAERSQAAVPDVAESDEGEPAQDAESAEAPTLEKFQQQLTEAAQAGDMAKALEIAEAAVAAFPDDLGMQINRFAIRLRSHTKQEEQENPDAAAERYLETAAVAEEIKAFGDRLPPQLQEVIPFAFYHQGRAYAHQGKVAESLAALKVAVDGGVDQVSFADDQFVSPVSENPEFQAGVAALRKTAARRSIAKTESFAFDFELPDLDQQPVKMADFQGKLLIVDIWGTWCPPCRQEIPHFIKLKQAYAKDLEIVGINYEDGEGEEVIANVRKFAAEQGMNYPLVIGDQATQEKIPDLRGYPTTLFLDRTGKVRLMIVGYHPYEMLEAYVTALLEESPGA
jgi:thiol-disulfide isomerase/thioredoxin